tara:strand:+ start:834 stop:1238 length:405 start_codon:yes stop_codon:yes gene_type:complete
MLLNRTIVKRLRTELNSVLKESVRHESGFLDDQLQEMYEVEVGSANFNDTEVTFKINLRLKGAKTQSQKDLEDFAKIDGLDLTKIAKLDGKDFSLSGFRRKARTKPYLIQDLKNGGEYIITADTAKKYFGKEVA